MATTPTTNRTEAANSLADIIRQNKKQRAETSSGVDVSDLRSLIEDLKKERAENSDYFKKISKFQQRYSDKITNPTTWKRMLVPSFTPFYKTMEKNWELDDKRRAAEKEIAKRERLEREKQTKELNARLDEFIKESSTLGLIAKKFGQNAARREALMNEEMKAIQKADADYMRNMDVISDKLSTINDDAKKEWAQRKGIQLVKIVEDEPSKEELAKIKNMLAEQLDKQGEQYEQQRIEAKTKATEDRRRQEALLKEQSWFRRMFKGDKTKEEKTGGGFLDSIVSWLTTTLGAGLGPLLVKAGLVAGILAFFKEYFQSPEFREKVNEFLTSINENILKPAFEGMVKFLKDNWETAAIALGAALALAFPLTTLRLIGGALAALYAAIVWAAKKIGGTFPGGPGVDLPDSADRGKGGGDKGAPGAPGDKGKGGGGKRTRTPQPRDPKTGRFTKKMADKGFLEKMKGKFPGLSGKGLFGKLLGGVGLSALLYSGDAGESNEAQGLRIISEYINGLPFDLDDDEYEEAISAAQGGFRGAQDWVAKHMEENDLMVHPTKTMPNPQAPNYPFKTYITKEQAAAEGLMGPQTNQVKRKAELQKNTFKSVLPAQSDMSNPLNDPFIASRVGMGPNPMMLNAPSSTTNNNSSTTIIPFRTVPDPSRSIMFQNKS